MAILEKIIHLRIQMSTLDNMPQDHSGNIKSREVLEGLDGITHSVSYLNTCGEGQHPSLLADISLQNLLESNLPHHCQ